MKQDRKSLLDFLRALFRKGKGEESAFRATPSEATVEKLVSRAIGEEPATEESRKDQPLGESQSEESAPTAKNSSGSGKEEAGNEQRDTDKEKDKDPGKEKESCPYATRRAIVESISEIRRFAEEHKLAASVLKSLLSLLAEIALGAMRGKISRQILEALLRAINYELAVDEAFKKGHTDGRKEWLEERYPSDDDGLPHINGGILHAEGTSIFDVAAEARR